MTIHETRPPPLTLEDVEGSIWESVAKLGTTPDNTVYTGIVDIIQQTQQTLAAGQAIDVSVKGDFKVSSLVLDVARDIQADFYLNDDTAPRWSTKDRLGMGGQFVLGNTTGQSVMRVTKVRIVAVNTHGSDPRDVRAWMVTQ